MGVGGRRGCPRPPHLPPGAPFGQQVPHADANAVHEGSGDDAPAGGHRGSVPTANRRGPARAHGRGVPRPPMDVQRLCPGARGRRVGRVDGDQPAGEEVDRRGHGARHVGGGGVGGGCGGSGCGGGRGGGSVSSSVGHRDGRRSPAGRRRFRGAGGGTHEADLVRGGRVWVRARPRGADGDATTAACRTHGF